MSAEYVDDVPYVRQYVAELAPTRLRLAAALNGVTPPPGDDFDYCELGCGHGDTLAALAAAYPEGRFLGIDLSAVHVASAKKLARDGALENVGFLERDFSDLANEDLGKFDYVVAHGVLTWVSPEKRKALIDLAHAKLKPGGLLYVTYNAMPGWASVEPLRQLLSSRSPAGTETLDRARHGLALAHAMESGGAEYFAKNPYASEMLAAMTQAGLPYVVHEYLHEHWTPMYSARVAYEMRASDLHFVGVLPVFLNFRDTAIPTSLEPLFAGVTERGQFESLKDYALNEAFRRDVYVKGVVPRTAEATSTYLDTTLFGLREIAPRTDRTVRFPHRTVSLEGVVFDAVLGALPKGATTVTAIAARHASTPGFGLEEVRAAMFRLLVAEIVTPMQTTTSSRPPNAEQRYSVPSVYNQMMLRRTSLGTPLVVVSRAAGTALPLAELEALAIRVLTESPPAERARWVRELVGRSVLRIRRRDVLLEDDSEQEHAILEAVEQLVTRKLGKLVELGVLAPVPS